MTIAVNSQISGIKKYKNGNCTVTLFPDGRKVREWEGEANPIFPESIDLKITNYCDAGCYYCHESSTKKGKHADVNYVYDLLSVLPSGVEIAIGGGNPLEHPHLIPLLFWMRKQGLVANITVNAKHLEEFAPLIWGIRAEGLIHGLGISYDPSLKDVIRDIADDNTVVHMIAGINFPHDAFLMLPLKLLILGYKAYGFGATYKKDKIESIISSWRYWIGTLLRKGTTTISFDALGLEQLDIRKIVPDSLWERCYMGDEGQFTMYIDAEKKEYAVSSTSKRIPIENKDIHEIFASL